MAEQLFCAIVKGALTIVGRLIGVSDILGIGYNDVRSGTVVEMAATAFPTNTRQ